MRRDQHVQMRRGLAPGPGGDQGARGVVEVHHLRRAILPADLVLRHHGQVVHLIADQFLGDEVRRHHLRALLGELGEGILSLSRDPANLPWLVRLGAQGRRAPFVDGLERGLPRRLFIVVVDEVDLLELPDLAAGHQRLQATQVAYSGRSRPGIPT
jgi:hypothetical protein